MAINSLPTSSEFRRSSAAGLLTGVLLLAVVVLSRRAVGAVTGLNSASATCLVAGVVMLIGLLSGLTLKRRQDRADSASLLVLASLCAAPGLVMGLALLPGSDASGLAALLGEFAILIASSMSLSRDTKQHVIGSPDVVSSLLVDDDAVVVVSASSNSSEGPSSTSPTGETVSQELHEPPVVDEVETVVAASPLAGVMQEESDQSELEPELDPSLTQWMRRALREGSDVVEGAVRVVLPVGAKQVAVHIPFAPAFSITPDFEAEPLDEADVEVHLSSVHSYGVRFEVTRRAGLDTAIAVQVGYFATAEMQDAVAA